MTPEIQSVLRLQSLDLRAAQLKKEIDALPKHVAEIEKKLELHKRRLEADRTALATNLKAKRNFEDDIKAQEQKMSKLRDQMAAAKTNDHYKTFQSEITFCEQAIAKAEDGILQTMGEAESLDKTVKAAEASLKQEVLQVEAEQERARKRSAEDRQFLQQALLERQQIAASLDKKLNISYERIRKKWNGVVVADATSGRCSACHMTLRPQFLQEIKVSTSLSYCESCGRLLYHNAPVSMEHELHQRP